MAYSQTVINLRQSFPLASAGMEERDGIFVLLVIIPIAIIYTLLHPFVIRMRNTGSSRVSETAPLHARVEELCTLLRVKCPELYLANRGLDQNGASVWMPPVRHPTRDGDGSNSGA